MSKSKGNVIDPLELIDKYGADALRFTLTALAAQGRDVRLSESRVEGYRNFATKLWNAARFCQMNGCRPVDGFDAAGVKLTVNRWIIGKLRDAEVAVSDAVAAYRFNDIAGSLYQFTWGTFCDWYVELVKPVLEGGDEAAKAETRATAAWVLDQILHLLHPIMPFITEELWQKLSDDRPGPLITSAWPVLDESLVDAGVNSEMDWVVRLISQVRTVRSEMNVPPKALIPLLLKDAGEGARANMETHGDLIRRLARLETLELLKGEVPKGAVQDVIDEATIVLPIAGVIDVAGEQSRLEKEITKLEGEVKRFEGKLANEKFIANAPETVVETERERLEDARQTRDKMTEALGRLTAAG
jgi:valyl-tRNA synthetase